MNRNDRRVATKKAIAAGAATNFVNLRRNAENAKNGDPALAVIDGWKIFYSIDPASGRHHLSASKVSPAAVDGTLRAAKFALDMPDKPEDCQWHVSENGIQHWSWGGKTEAPRLEAKPGFVVEIHANADEIGQQWLAIALAAASAGAQMAEKMGLSTSGAHFSLTTPSGAKACVHMTRPGETPTPAHTVH